jgi:prophage regulatory protein
MMILRVKQCVNQMGYKSRTSLYRLINRGLWTPPVKISTRSSGWPKYEVEALYQARVAGMGEEEIKRLVADLYNQRKGFICKLSGGVK